MAKNRLGRGLGDLISGGIKKTSDEDISESNTKQATKSVAKTKKSTKPQKKVVKAATPVKIEEPKEPSEYQEIDISRISKNPHQPRKHFSEEEIKELAESIDSEGLLQPIVVRQKDNLIELIAGERRLRAFESLGLKKIPARVVVANDTSSAVLALIENLQREGLNPIEESLGYASLIRDFTLTQEAVAQRLGKPRASIANSLRLLQLDKEIQGYLSKKLISIGHAKVLLGLEEPAQQLLIARQIIEQGLSVRQVEQLIRKTKASSPTSQSKDSKSGQNERESTIIRSLEKQIESRLNTRVLLKHKPKKGKLIIEYYGNEDLQRILEKTGLV